MDKMTAAKIAVSKNEPACSIPFSRRETAMAFVIALAALLDSDIVESINVTSLFKTDMTELDELKDKLSEFLSTT